MFGKSEKKMHFKRWYAMAAFFLGTSLSLYTPRASAQSSETEERSMISDRTL